MCEGILTKYNIQFLESNLVCPKCKGKIKISKSIIFCKNCHNTYSLINDIPCFINDSLSEHQKSELKYYLTRKEAIISTKFYYNQDESRYNWALNWINKKTITKNSKIICIGGSYRDDLPHVKSDFKFNIDHLAHQFIKLFPKINRANVKYIASRSEALPFKDNYADIIYSRNSLDHVNSPIKTLLEIHRVLKPEGRFFLSVYYNSFFINSNETTNINDEFVENHIKNMFSVEWMQITPSNSLKHIFSDWWLRNAWFGVKGFLKGEREKLSWLNAVLRKKKNYNSYDDEILENYENLISNFHSALYYDVNKKYYLASNYYKKIIRSKPYLETDKMRILYSKIRFFSITDRKAFKNFFNEFKLTNKDPFWWLIIIDSSLPFMKKELKKSIKLYFPNKERLFLEEYIKRKENTPIMKIFFKIKNTINHLFLFFPRYIKLNHFYSTYIFKIFQFLKNRKKFLTD